ncbi:beta-galactosidase [Leifsonia xyli]|uniref:beta-galactosidase n=1 Tax=Leifsonia xyli TaxID=1575 RepID=UPI00031D3EB2|nr:beta-galactosidase [Leifsonia xyli]
MSVPTRLHGADILIDGQPRAVLAGEIHYFRTARADWPDRLRAAAEAGLNAVASYIPWIWHELPDGRIDLTGETRPERDLGAFIDLCAEHGMWSIAWPGPFQMADLKNEGLPYRLRREHPEIHPVGWDGEPAPTRRWTIWPRLSWRRPGAGTTPCCPRSPRDSARTPGR